jgi:ribonuclease E
VGKRIKVRVERVLDGRAYAIAIRKTKATPEPLTAEGEAEKPTRKPPARKGATVAKESEPEVEEIVVAQEPEAESEGEETPEVDEAPKPKKKTRRGSRGGRKRKKTPATAEAAATEPGAEGASQESAEQTRPVTIHVPGEDLGRGGAAEPAEAPAAEPEPEAAEEPTTAEAGEAPKPKKKTRRGSRGGKNRKKKPATATQNGAEAAGSEAAPEAEPASENGDFDYVPMSEWADELETNR